MSLRLAPLSLAVLLIACGARSSLEGVDAGRNDGAVARFDAGRRDGGGMRDGGGPTDAGPDAGSDAGPDAGPERCQLELSGAPTVVSRRGAHNEGVTHPIPVALGPDRFALVTQHQHFWHPDVRVAELTLGEAWPDGIEETRPAVRWGIDAHSSHTVTRGPGARLTLSHYQGDLAAGRPQGNVAVPLDLETWSVQPAEFIHEGGSGSYSISASGDGSFVTYNVRQDDTRELWLARLDATGAPAGEPMLLAESREGTFGAFTDVLPDGAVLLTQNTADGVRFGRIDWASRSYTAGDLVAPIPGRSPRRPTLRVRDGQAWAVWREEVVGEPTEEYVVRLARLDPLGGVLDQPLEERLPLARGPSLALDPDGATVLLPLPGSPEHAPGEVGASTLRMIRVRGDGLVQTIDLPTTRMSASRVVEATWLSARRLVVALAAHDSESSMNAIHLARFDCVLE